MDHSDEAYAPPFVLPLTDASVVPIVPKSTKIVQKKKLRKWLLEWGLRWWAVQGSNLRPPACKAGGNPT
jgi:hypothetical protein